MVEKDMRKTYGSSTSLLDFLRHIFKVLLEVWKWYGFDIIVAELVFLRFQLLLLILLFDINCVSVRSHRYALTTCKASDL